MQRISLLTVGSVKTDYFRFGCEDYVKRLGRTCTFDVIEVPASKQKDAQKQQEEECQVLLQRIEKLSGALWVLDEGGMQYTSANFAQEIGMCADQGQTLTFILGGAYGLTDSLRQKADKILALSAMTLPHELCRLVFLEQLYRAQEIRRGSGYHH